MQRLLIPTLLFMASFGCGGGATTDESATGTSADTTANTTVETTADTPEAAYTAFREAAKAKDWKTAASLLSPESQAMLAGMSIMGSSFATMDESGQEDPGKAKELKELLTKHGVDLEGDDSEPSAEEQKAGPEAVMMAMTESIPDKPAFIAEINAWMEKNGDDSGGGFAELGNLSDLTIDGDTATAQSETEFGAQPIEFRKTGDNWVIHLPVGGPPEEQMSDFDEPDDGSPGLGTFWLGEKSVTLRHATAYRSKFFDDPCTVVLLTVRPLPERQLEELKRMLKEDGNDDAFFPGGTQVKLTLDEAGELMFLFAWADNMSINSNSGVDIDVKIDGNRVQGAANMSDPGEVADTTYRFEAKFDAELLTVSEN